MMACTSNFDTAIIDGNPYLVARGPFSRAEGLSRLEKNPGGKYAGMVFVFPYSGEYEFHTEGFKHYLMLCNFEGGVKRNCICMPPNAKVKVNGKVFLEELYADGKCTKKVFF